MKILDFSCRQCIQYSPTMDFSFLLLCENQVGKPVIYDGSVVVSLCCTSRTDRRSIWGHHTGKISYDHADMYYTSATLVDSSIVIRPTIQPTNQPIAVSLRYLNPQEMLWTARSFPSTCRPPHSQRCLSQYHLS